MPKGVESADRVAGWAEDERGMASFRNPVVG